MPQRLLLEGADIDELLLRVQAEHGSQATIVHAEQKLVGGVAGFFARRRYELAVQIEDDVPAAEAEADVPAREPSSFEDLLADADGADGGPLTPRDARPATTRTAVTSVPAAIAQLPSPRGRRLSTQSQEFEELLSSLVGRVERDPDPADGLRPAAVTEAPPAGEAPGSSAALARALSRSTGPRSDTAFDRVVIRAEDASRSAPSEPHPLGADVRPEASVPASGVRAAEALRALGLPADKLPPHLAGDPRTALLDALQQLPGAAPDRLWGTTVVVGPAELAHRTVAAIVEHAGGAASEALVATSSAPSGADLAVRASARCATHGSAVVVIETPATRAAAHRAGRLIAGLGLGTVVAAVDATRDAAATREWLAELGSGGRPVDQLAAFEVGESPAPLTVVGLGPDVAWIDGRPATVGTWAAPCLDRLLADRP